MSALASEPKSGSAATAAAPGTARKAPLIPFACKFTYGDGSLPDELSAIHSSSAMPSFSSSTTPASSSSVAFDANSSTSAAAPASGIEASSTSTTDIPIVPLDCSPLVCRLKFLLHPKYRRSDVGTLISSLKALHSDCHYLFGYRLHQPENGNHTFQEIDGVQYPILFLTLWSNPALPANTQLLLLQRGVLAKLPTVFAQLFGARLSAGDLLKGMIQSVYLNKGLQAFHPVQKVAGEFQAEVSWRGKENLVQILTVLQEYLVQSVATNAASDANAASHNDDEEYDAVDTELSPDDLAKQMMEMNSSSGNANSSPNASNNQKAASILRPPHFHFDLRRAPLESLPRSFSSVMTLLKKVAAFVMEVDLEIRGEGRMGLNPDQRYLKAQLQGADVATICQFLQFKLGSENAAAPNENSTVASASSKPESTSASFFRRLRGLSVLAEFFGLIHALPQPAPVSKNENRARLLLGRVTNL